MDKAFKALGDPTRRKILQLLKKGVFPAGEIQKHFKITAPSLSHHLDILKRSELVISERKGQFIYYSLNTSVFQEVVKGLMNLIK